jgi:hypothetical protein
MADFLGAPSQIAIRTHLAGPPVSEPRIVVAGPGSEVMSFRLTP